MNRQAITQVKFAEYQDEIVSMMRAMVYLEPQPVDIPIQRYVELDEMGVLKPFLWFDAETVKGVALLFVSPSLRNAAVTVVSTDVLWVKPKYRGNSSEFVEGIKQQLKDMGVNYWYISSRNNHPIDRFLLKNDFKPLERLYFCEV